MSTVTAYDAVVAAHAGNDIRGITLGASSISDLRIALTASGSDIKSAITAATSDIKSQATVAYASLSDLQSDFQSRVPKLVATNSQLTAVQSDIKSNINSISATVVISTSDISNIVSGIVASGGGATQSQVQAIVDAATSDIKSQATATYATLSDLQSDFQSRVPKAVATNSQVSDIQSYLAGLSGMVSDIDSALTSQYSDVHSALGDLTVDINASQVWAYATRGLTEAVTLGASSLSDLRSAITAVATSSGAGADSVTVTWTAGGLPVADGSVWITTDSDGTNLVAGTLVTNSEGKATFMLDAGSVYWVWGQKDGYNSLHRMFVAVAD